jgi:D-xylose transport system ATP-binding protein
MSDSMPNDGSAAAIQAAAIGKSYGATRALEGVTLSWRKGDVQAIAGENGAGKSTLVKIISGVIPDGDYDGELRVEGRPVHFSNVRDAERSGVFLVPQELNVVPELSIAEHLFLNREPVRTGLIDLRELWCDTERWLETFHLPLSPLTKMGQLHSHEQQLVSIARAMTQGVRLLILDEPTASLTARETELLFERIRAFRELGVTTLYISHRLAEFGQIADAVTVMRDGRVVDDFRIEDENDIPRRVVKAMIGRDLGELYPKIAAVPGESLLELRNWSVASGDRNRPDLVQEIDLELKAGEVVGVFGLIGSGASDLARSIFGAHSNPVRGDAVIRGRPISLRNPQSAIASGIAYLPSDRKRDGLVLAMSVSANISLAALSRWTCRGFIDRRQELMTTGEYIRALRIKLASPEQPVGDLSGGNQQKAAAAKWLLNDPDIIVFEEPTRGVDIGARVEIYNIINDFSRNGKAVLIVSTDLPEVIGMSDRVIAMRDGRITGQWTRDEVHEESVMLAAAGGNKGTVQ